jgi:ferredoxin-NADP reductase
MLPTGLIPLRIEKIIRETEDTKSFLLRSQSDKEIKYTAGQFLTFVFETRNGEEARRNYSISSSPGEPLQITVKRIPTGAYSRWLIDEAKEGDVLQTTGVSGFFVLPDYVPDFTQLVFFAAGSGIAPIISLIKTILHRSTNIPVALIYSNASPATTIFYNELKTLQETFPGRLRIEFLFSSYAVVSRRRLNVAMIERIARDYFSGKKNALFYLCGPFEYMRTITIILRTEGVPENSIRKEIFNVERPVNKPVPPDIESHHVLANIHNTAYTFSSQYPDTILQTAKAKGFSLPYSCEAGQCGTCAATCISGNVWMWRNDVLLDEEIAKGRILTCTGYAVGGDVVLQY